MWKPTNLDLDRHLAKKLSVLRKRPLRDARLAERGRAAFLAQAEQLAADRPVPVSPLPKRRHIGWMNKIQSVFPIRRKERTPMFGTIATILLVFSLVLGGSGITVAAAQQSMPDDTLYPVKTWSEEVRASLAVQEQTRFQLALERAERRAEEVMFQLRARQMVSAEVQTQLRAEYELALQLAVGQPDDVAVRELAQIREQLQNQEQEFLRLGPQEDPQREAVMEQTRLMLQERLQLCQQGMEDPQALRLQLQQRQQMQEQEQEQEKQMLQEQQQEQLKLQEQEQLKLEEQEQLKLQEQEQLKLQEQEQLKLQEQEQMRLQEQEQLKLQEQEQLKLQEQERIRMEEQQQQLEKDLQQKEQQQQQEGSGTFGENGGDGGGDSDGGNGGDSGGGGDGGGNGGGGGGGG